MLPPIDLTIKQRLFCERYLSNGYNGTKAAIDAGYSKDTAYSMANENLNKPEIKKYVSKRMKEAIEKAGAGLDWRIEMLKKTADMCMQGQASQFGTIHPTGIINSIAELNKMEGTYAPTKTETTTTSVDVSETKNLIDEYKKEF